MVLVEQLGEMVVGRWYVQLLVVSVTHLWNVVIVKNIVIFFFNL